MKFKIILTQFRLSFLLAFLVLALAYSCNEPIEVEQEPIPEVSEEAIFEALQAEIAKIQRENKLAEVGHIDGETAADFYRGSEQSHTSRNSICDSPPSCPSTPRNDVYSFGSCSISYSYDLYICAGGGVGIYNFQITSTSGNCYFYDILVTENYNDGDLTDYQKYYNYFAAIILSNLEDALFSIGIVPSIGGTSQIFSYIPNLCSVVCKSNGAREECGQDCCIRIVFYNTSTKSRITDVVSAGECGGTTATCTNNQTGDCQNHNCTYLNIYR